MAIALSLVGAIVFGCADFWGGLATRRSDATVAVVVITQVAGLAALMVIAPLSGATHVAVSDLVWGAGAGLCGATGLLFFYRALADGTMSIVSPITAVVSAIVPLLAGVALGDRPAAWAWAGIVIGLGAIILFGGVPHPHGVARVAVTGAVLGGLGFGTFFVLLARSGSTAGMWPLVAARGCSGALLFAWAKARRQPIGLPRAVWKIALAAGIGDVSANALYLAATHHGLLAVVGVIIALYPASTLVLARIVLHERLQPLHWVALVAAAGAVTMIVVGS